MKKPNSKSIILFLLLFMASLSSIPMFQSENSSVRSDSGIILKIKAAPISINGNADLQNESTSGNGTLSNPYIIEDLAIDVSALTISAIEIRNTDAYFTIRNCTLLGNDWESTVELHNVTHGKLTNNTLTGIFNLAGFFFNNSMSNSVSKNNISHYGVGIWLWDNANNTLIVNNTMNSCNTGVGIRYSANNTVINNTNLGDLWYDQMGIPSQAGLYGYYSNNNTYIDNHVTGTYSTHSSVQLDYSYDERIINNIFENNWNDDMDNAYGILIYNCNRILMHNNTIRNQRDLGGGMGGISRGIWLYESSNCNMTSNILNDTGDYGIHLETSYTNRIINNKIHHLTDLVGGGTRGIYFDQSSNNYVTYNIINDTGDYGVYLANSDNNQINWNLIYNYSTDIYETGGSTGNNNDSNDYHPYPILTNAGLSPLTGNITSDFNFTITYTDLGNIAPTFIRVVIDGASNPMSIRNSSDFDFTDGVEFIYSTSLSYGSHEYHFEASNGSDVERVLRIGESSGPTILNAPPSLSNGTVSPSAGNESTTWFTFTVEYLDIDNDQPTYVRVYINSTPYDMGQLVLDTNYTDGCVYNYTTNLTAGNYTYYFTTYDGTYPAIDPDPGVYQGPTVEEEEEPPTPSDDGIPAFDLLFVNLALVVAVAFYVLKKREHHF